MSRYYKGKGCQPVGVVEARRTQRAEPEISPETKQSSPQIAQGKSSKPKEKKSNYIIDVIPEALVTELPKDSTPKMIERQSVSLRQQQARTVGTNRGKNRIQILMNMSYIVGMESLSNSLNVVVYVYHVGLVLLMPREVLAPSSRNEVMEVGGWQYTLFS